MGSMPVPNIDVLKKVITDILETTNYRIILCKGNTEILSLPIHHNLLIINYVNHDWLLPQCKLAIIHGGAGTIATTLKAKIPMIITSVFGDQPWWGKIIESKTLGLHIPFKKLNSKKILELINRVQSDKIKINITDIGEKIMNENGTKKALHLINQYLKIY